MVCDGWSTSLTGATIRSLWSGGNVMGCRPDGLWNRFRDACRKTMEILKTLVPDPLSLTPEPDPLSLTPDPLSLTPDPKPFKMFHISQNVLILSENINPQKPGDVSWKHYTISILRVWQVWRSKRVALIEDETLLKVWVSKVNCFSSSALACLSEAGSYFSSDVLTTQHIQGRLWDSSRILHKFLPRNFEVLLWSANVRFAPNTCSELIHILTR